MLEIKTRQCDRCLDYFFEVDLFNVDGEFMCGSCKKENENMRGYQVKKGYLPASWDLKKNRNKTWGQIEKKPRMVGFDYFT